MQLKELEVSQTADAIPMRRCNELTQNLFERSRASVSPNGLVFKEPAYCGSSDKAKA